MMTYQMIKKYLNKIKWFLKLNFYEYITFCSKINEAMVKFMLSYCEAEPLSVKVLFTFSLQT